MEFDNILLEEEQRDLLCTLVEASRSVSQDQREKFTVARDKSGTSVLHNGLDGNLDAFMGDIKALGAEGLVSLSYTSRGTPRFYVTPLGYRYCEHLKEAMEEPVEGVQEHIRKYIESGSFQKRYPDAYAKWKLAESALWSSESQQQLTTVGHHCREAMQEFAQRLVECFEPPDIDPNKAHTVARIQSVLKHKSAQLGSTVQPFLEALLPYWGTVSDLVQRQEHGAQKEGEPLTWEDGRRVVFQTLIIMYEIDRALMNL